MENVKERGSDQSVADAEDCTGTENLCLEIDNPSLGEPAGFPCCCWEGWEISSL